jgi:beta-galactosidase
MMRFRLPLLVLSNLFLLTAFSHSQSGANCVKYNSDWKVLVGDPKGADQPGSDDSQWKRVTTPYAWNEDSAFRVSIHDLPTAVAWYRKHFRLPAGSAGQKIFIEFEGVRQAG